MSMAFQLDTVLGVARKIHSPDKPVISERMLSSHFIHTITTAKTVLRC